MTKVRNGVARRGWARPGMVGFFLVGSGIAGNGVVVLGKAWFFWNRQEAILIRPGVASRGMVWQCEVRCG